MQPRKIAQDVDYSVVAAVREQSLDLPGVYVKDEFIRYYPLYEGGAHLLGYLRGITVDELQVEYEEYRLSDVIGRDGLERVYEKELRGQAGGWQIEVDALGRKKRDLGELPSIPGSNLVLNVDARLQKKAVEACFPENQGAIIAMDPNTGGIKALVSEPSYDPNLLSGYITQSQWARIANDPEPSV